MLKLKDSELIIRIQQGEKQLFQELMERYYDDIYRFCYYKISDEHLAYDCTQETFLKLIRFLDTYTEKQKFKAYLFQIARNVCNDYFRNKPIDSTSLELSVPLTAMKDKRIEQTETAQVVKQALNQLPDMQKDVIILRFYHEFKLREIARIVGVSLPTAKSRLKQGLDKLKQIFREEDYFA